jgi:hypothetical protein
MWDSEKLINDPFIRSTLQDKIDAIKQYEGVIWKLRSGYIVILYGALTLVLGREGIHNICDTIGNRSRALAFVSLIVGLSLSVFWLDLDYVCKRLKIAIARDKLVDFACKRATREWGQDELVALLHIAGETKPKRLPCGLLGEYRAKRRWNLYRVLLPIYCTPPIVALAIWISCRFA